jgi:hypothetical protein
VLQIVEDQAAVVRRMFEMFVSGMSASKIASTLNRLGIPSPKGMKWGQPTVRNLLLNQTYIGVQASFVWKRESGVQTTRKDLTNPNAIVVADAHPPIIDRSLWEAARSRPMQPQTKSPRLLTKLLYVNGVRLGGFCDHGERQYRATGPRKGTAWLPSEQTDARVWEAFAGLATGPEFVQGLMERAQNPHQQQIITMEIEHLRGELGRHQRRLNRLVDMRADGELTKEEFSKRRDVETGVIERLNAELIEQQAKIVTFDSTHATRVVRAVQALLAGRTRLTLAQKRRVLTSIVRRVDLEAERVTRPLDHDEQGRFLPGQYARWEIRNIEFRLALPAADAATLGLGAGAGALGADGAGGPDGGDGADIGDSRPCQCVRDS